MMLDIQRGWTRAAALLVTGLLVLPAASLAQRQGGGEGRQPQAGNRGGMRIMGVVRAIDANSMTVEMQQRGQRPGGGGERPGGERPGGQRDDNGLFAVPLQGGGQPEGQPRTIEVKLTGETKYVALDDARERDIKPGMMAMAVGMENDGAVDAAGLLIHQLAEGADPREAGGLMMMAAMRIMAASGVRPQQGQRPAFRVGVVRQADPLVLATRDREGNEADVPVILTGETKVMKTVASTHSEVKVGNMVAVVPVAAEGGQGAPGQQGPGRRQAGGERPTPTAATVLNLGPAPQRNPGGGGNPPAQ